MASQEEIEEIFSRITVKFDNPVPIGSRCQSNVYYRVEDLTEEELLKCAEYVGERILNVCSPAVPDLILKLPGGFTFFADKLYDVLLELLCTDEQSLKFEQYEERKIMNGLGDKYRGAKCILVTDVITTAKSSLEAHTKATLRGMHVLCWASLIDRTFGPGPVSVVSAITGAPVEVITNIG